MKHRLKLTLAVLLVITSFTLLAQMLRPTPCWILDERLTAYEWYMIGKPLSYDQWLEFVELSFEWSRRECEREESKSNTSGAEPRHNQGTRGEPERPYEGSRRSLVLPSTPSSFQESI